MRHRIYLSREKGGFQIPLARNMINAAVRAALDAEKIDFSCEISVLLTDDEGIRALNSDFRAKDKPTDVLSFPANEMTAGRFEPDEMEVSPKTGRVVLGDMAISLERVKAQAEEFGHSLRRELQYLTVHSVLHLLGYDHEDDGEMKKQMREREKIIIQAMGGEIEQ